MILSEKSSGSFTPCPEYTGRAVCVDVTPLEKQHSSYGERDIFKIVFEVDLDRDDEDKSRFCVWSRPFTPSLNEKANLRKFIRQWFGRELTAQELKEFDTEDLIGKPAYLVVIHEEADNGNVYANIAAIKPHREADGEPLKPSGKFVRKKDREQKPKDGKGAASSYRRAEDPGEDSGREDWMGTVVHVGKHAGVQLGDLDEEAVDALLRNWVPVYEKMDKPRAADKRLFNALSAAREALAAAPPPSDGEVPY
ncbi:MAG: hypothetical protein JJU00_14850 [Opitutales bacterium]|nr:hypothetical protein [Opitutales bacterium]